jgi:histone acetyltransferase (RNA polymerase elongator complex component)
MVGLPSDAERKCIETARKFIEMKPDCVRIYPTLVVKETGLENLLNAKQYSPFTLEESVQIVKKLLALFYVNNINVIRVGLQATDDIQLGKAILDGPYHPAFRELVESEMIKDYLKSIVIENKVKSNLIVKTNKKNVSKIIGNKKSNTNYMKNELNIVLKTKESYIDINTLEIILDDKVDIKISMNDIYKKLYKVYNL